MPKRICIETDCEKAQHARGFCTKHYQRRSKAGEFTPRPPRLCSAPDCGKPHHSRGYCSAHSIQFRRGQPLAPPTRSSLPAVDRFWAQVTMTDDCWLWSGPVASSGYAYFKGDGCRYGHRFSYAIHKGAIPDGLVIDHICRNKTCVNPDHLRVVTTKQNLEHLKGANRNSSTGIRNVYRIGSQRRPFVVIVGHFGKAHRRGPFATAEEADAVARTLRAQLFTHDDAVY